MSALQVLVVVGLSDGSFDLLLGCGILDGTIIYHCPSSDSAYLADPINTLLHMNHL